jgi:uncharacterized protein YjiK
MSNQSQVIEKITNGSAVLYGSSSYATTASVATNILATSLTASLYGTASNAISASYAPSTPSDVSVSSSWASQSLFSITSSYSTKSLYQVIDDRYCPLSSYNKVFFTAALATSASLTGISGVTYSPITNTIYVVRNVTGAPGIISEFDFDGKLLRTIVETGLWIDTEGMCWMSGSIFAVVEEAVNTGALKSRIHVVEINPYQRVVDFSSGSLYDTTIQAANLGVEGVTYDPDRQWIYFITEKSSNGNSTTGVWNIWKLVLSGSSMGTVGDVSQHIDLIGTTGFNTYGTDIADLHFDRETQTFYVLSQESSKVVRLTYTGQFMEQLVLTGYTQPEGIALTPDRSTLFISGENRDLGIYTTKWAPLPMYNPIIQSGIVSSSVLAIEGTASQIGNLTEWRNSSHAILSYVSTSGQFVGTSSLATSSSYATTSSYSLNGGGTGTSLGTGSTYPFTASWAVSASYTTTMSVTINYVLSASFASSSLTASYALNGGTGGGGGGNASGIGYINLPVQSAKLPITSSARIDAGDTGWKLLFDPTSNQSASYQFLVPHDYYNKPTASLTFAMASTQTGTNAVAWKVNVYVPSGEDVQTPSVASNIFTSSLTNNQAAGIPTYATIGLLNDDGMSAGEYCWINIERIANAAVDTATGDVEMVSLAFVYNTTAVYNASTASYSPGEIPIGGVIAWLKSFSGVPALSTAYVECNGQVLSDAASPLNGQTIPNLNNSGGGATNRFLRGATTSGGTGGTEDHTHTITNLNTGTENSTYTACSGADAVAAAGHIHDVSGTSDSASTLPSYYEVVWIIRVK